MDPNLNLDVVSLDKGIADLEATGTSTWDFQTQDCDPLSLAERLKALKERDTAPLLTSGPSNSTPEPEGECKAARHVAAPFLSAWDDVPKNTVYTKEDGSYARITVDWQPQYTSGDQKVNLDIFLSPYNCFCMFKASKNISWSVDEQETSSFTVTKLGEENINKPLAAMINISGYHNEYGEQRVVTFCLYYSGVGTQIEYSLLAHYTYDAYFEAGKHLFYVPSVIYENYYYRGKMNPHYDYYKPEGMPAQLDWAKEKLSGLCPAHPLYYRLSPYTNARKGYLSNAYNPWYNAGVKNISQYESTFSTDVKNNNEFIGVQSLNANLGLHKVQFANLGQPFDSKYTNIPEEWNS